MADTVGLPATDRNKAKIRRRPMHLWSHIRDSWRREARNPAP
jgi:hypothetical protein